MYAHWINFWAASQPSGGRANCRWFRFNRSSFQIFFCAFPQARAKFSWHTEYEGIAFFDRECSRTHLRSKIKNFKWIELKTFQRLVYQLLLEEYMWKLVWILVDPKYTYRRVAKVQDLWISCNGRSAISKVNLKLVGVIEPTLPVILWFYTFPNLNRKSTVTVFRLWSGHIY